jgi:hypothetical protein
LGAAFTPDLAPIDNIPDIELSSNAEFNYVALLSRLERKVVDCFSVE